MPYLALRREHKKQQKRYESSSQHYFIQPTQPREHCRANGMRFGHGYYMFSLLAGLVGRANFRNVFLYGSQLLFYGIGDRMQRCAVLRPVPAELIYTFDQRPCYEQQDSNCKENNDERSQRARDMPVFHKRYV